MLITGAVVLVRHFGSAAGSVIGGTSCAKAGVPVIQTTQQANIVDSRTALRCENMMTSLPGCVGTNKKAVHSV